MERTHHQPITHSFKPQSGPTRESLAKPITNSGWVGLVTDTGYGEVAKHTDETHAQEHMNIMCARQWQPLCLSWRKCCRKLPHVVELPASAGLEAGFAAHPFGHCILFVLLVVLT